MYVWDKIHVGWKNCTIERYIFNVTYTKVHIDNDFTKEPIKTSPDTPDNTDEILLRTSYEDNTITVRTNFMIRPAALIVTLLP